MSHRHRYRPSGHSYRELIATVQESACDLIEHQAKRDQSRFSYEKHKLALLILVAASLWIMFVLLWEKLDEVRPEDPAPAIERHPAPAFPAAPYDEPIAIRYA